jgi:large subunit ribosomal protein L3
MGKTNKPRCGSTGYSPRVKARKQTPSIGNYAPSKDAVPLGFIGYKAGMTHVIAKDLYKNSPAHNQDVQLPVTIIDCPPLTVFGIRAHCNGYNAEEVFTDVLAEKLDKDLSRATSLPKDTKNADAIKRVEDNIAQISSFVLLVHTQPRKSGIRKKTPEITEIAIGGDVKTQWAYAKSVLGKELTVKDVFKDNDLLDAIAVTKGKGYQGQVKRWGVKIQKRKHLRGGHKRHVGAIGLRGLHNLAWMVPMAGHMGYHNRVDFNKPLLKIGEKGEEVNPKGGFVNYGLVKGAYLLLKGSIPGPKKRTIALRKAIRPQKKSHSYAIERISTESQQGV